MKKKPYEVIVATCDGTKSYSISSYSVNNATWLMPTHAKYEYIKAVFETTWERYHILQLAQIICDSESWDSCDTECAEICHYAGFDEKWQNANSDCDIEEVMSEVEKYLNVTIL